MVFKYPEDESKTFVKRVVGLPGETVEVRDKALYIDGVLAETSYVQHADPALVDRRDNFGPLTIPPDSYFMMGDNRDQSLDSRFWGPLPGNKILGRVMMIYWSWDRHERRMRWDRIGRQL